MHCRPGISRQGWRGPCRGQRAFALPFAIIISLLVIILGLAFMEMSRMDAVGSVKDTQTLKALAAAEIGLQRAKAMAKSQNLSWGSMTYNGISLRFATAIDSLYNNHPVCLLFSGEAAGSGDTAATYSVVIEDISGDAYKIHAFGFAGDRVQHITQNTRTYSYGAFSWFTNDENGLHFASGDDVNGWVYTNDTLNIHGRPTFTGKVNSGASDINYYHGGAPADNPDFQQGITLNSTQIDITAVLSDGHVSAVREAALQDGIWLGANAGRPYYVTFNANGTVTIEKELANGSLSPVLDQKALSTTNGAIYIEDTVRVSGTVNGEVTRATPENKDIYILDNLVYAYPGDPEDAFDEDFDFDEPLFDDKLALIAGHDIVFYKTKNSAWPQMHVMASLMAVTGSVRSDQSKSHSYGYKNLHILGSIAQYLRGPVGNDNNERGFFNNYKYDERLLDNPPSYLPTATYSYDTWKLN